MTNKAELNQVITFFKESYSNNLKTISFLCDKSISKETNEKIGFIDEIADDENAIAALNSLNKKYGDDDQYFYSADASYDKDGNVAVLFNYYEKAIHLDHKFEMKYIVYVDNDFDMSFYNSDGNIKKIDDNWYILSRHID